MIFDSIIDLSAWSLLSNNFEKMSLFKFWGQMFGVRSMGTQRILGRSKQTFDRSENCLLFVNVKC